MSQKIETLHAARELVKQGVNSAGFIAGLTAVLATASMVSGEPIGSISVISFIDAGVYLAIALGIHNNSRIAAIVGLVLYVLERI